MEYRIYGPPGTGKTTLLVDEIIPESVKKYGQDRVMVTSFTKTAAINITQKVDLEEHMIGTLHSICYKALGSPVMAAEFIKDWNNLYPNFSTTDTNGLFAQLQVLRAKLVPIEKWPKKIISLYSKWKDFKQGYNSLDFEDLIEQATHNVPVAPGRPAVIIADEVQDFTVSQIRLLRSWGIIAKELILVGDEDQSIYFFSGTTPDSFLYPEIPQDRVRVLHQSYRIPKQVHKLASKISKKIAKRFPKEYLPRPEQGKVIRSQGTFKQNEATIKKAIKYNTSTMFLATCSYMLEPIRKNMVRMGVPFSNPYRLEQKLWNPMIGKKVRGFKSFIRAGHDDHYWDLEQFIEWIVDVDFLTKDSKKLITQLATSVVTNLSGGESSRHFISKIIPTEYINQALSRDVNWLKKHTKKKMDYYIKVYNKYGKKPFFSQPDIMIGTIHSFKGAEANVCFLYPDISTAAHKERLKSRDDLDNHRRIFYVGVTRARQVLHLMSPASKMFF